MRHAFLLVCLGLVIGSPAMLHAQAADAKPVEAKQEKPTKHPLDPLTEEEIKLASKILKDEKKATRRSLFTYIGLSEPDKGDVLVYKMGDKFERRAKAIFYDTASNPTTEAIVNLTDKKIESTKNVGRQGQWNQDDNKLAERILRTDPQWQAALKKRKIDPIDTAIFAMPNRGYVDVKPDGSRYVLAGTFIDDRVDGTQIEDLLALVMSRSAKWNGCVMAATRSFVLSTRFLPKTRRAWRRRGPRPSR
jgi:Cu2+-containing amine oxidase